MDARLDRHSLAHGFAAALATLVAAATAHAQPAPLGAGVEHGGARSAGWRLDPRPAGPVSLVAWGQDGVRLRPRHALRVRFDGATRAMRGMGVQAQDCNALVRSSSRLAALTPGGPAQWQVSVSLALDCRFF